MWETQVILFAGVGSPGYSPRAREGILRKDQAVLERAGGILRKDQAVLEREEEVSPGRRRCTLVVVPGPVYTPPYTTWVHLLYTSQQYPAPVTTR